MNKHCLSAELKTRTLRLFQVSQILGISLLKNVRVRNWPPHRVVVMYNCPSPTLWRLFFQQLYETCHDFVNLGILWRRAVENCSWVYISFIYTLHTTFFNKVNLLCGPQNSRKWCLDHFLCDTWHCDFKGQTKFVSMWCNVGTLVWDKLETRRNWWFMGPWHYNSTLVWVGESNYKNMKQLHYA